MVKKQTEIIIPLVLLYLFTACDIGISQPSDATPIVSQTGATTQTIPFSITVNPEQLARWQEYEHALAIKYLSYLPPEDILCEWEILGQTELEVYVWAVCLGLPPEGRSELVAIAPIASIPAVIHLRTDGSIERVELPMDNGRGYGEGIREIFPADVRERISERTISIVAMADHAKIRRKNPSPPLIVLLATPQP